MNMIRRARKAAADSPIPAEICHIGRRPVTTPIRAAKIESIKKRIHLIAAWKSTSANARGIKLNTITTCIP